MHKHSSLELFDVEIIDDLPIPSPLPVAEKQSDVKGVFWTGSKRKWEIKILIVHKEINFGSTVNQDIAVRVAEYVLANLDEPKIKAMTFNRSFIVYLPIKNATLR